MHSNVTSKIVVGFTLRGPACIVWQNRRCMCNAQNAKFSGAQGLKVAQFGGETADLATLLTRTCRVVSVCAQYCLQRGSVDSRTRTLFFDVRSLIADQRRRDIEFSYCSQFVLSDAAVACCILDARLRLMYFAFITSPSSPWEGWEVLWWTCMFVWSVSPLR